MTFRIHGQTPEKNMLSREWLSAGISAIRQIGRGRFQESSALQSLFCWAAAFRGKLAGLADFPCVTWRAMLFRKSSQNFAHRWSLPGAAAIATTLLLATVSRAETFTHITAEDGGVQYDLRQSAADGTYTEPSSNYRFKLTFKQGERNTSEPVLVGTLKSTQAEHFRGESAIQIQIDARDEVKSTKAAYKVSIDSVGGHDRFTPQVAQPRDWYNGFAVKIDPAYYKLPDTGELLFEQWWQGSPFHPPVALVIVNPKDSAAKGWANAGANGNFALMLRDDDHNALSTTPGEPQYYNLGPVTTGKWLRWIIHVRPSPIEAAGAVTVTLDGEEKLKLDHIKVGYNPANPQYGDHKPSNRLASVNVCLYRLNGQNFQRFYFDEIKFADSQRDAEP
jgi:hypothetical protein